VRIQVGLERPKETVYSHLDTMADELMLAHSLGDFRWIISRGPASNRGLPERVSFLISYDHADTTNVLLHHPVGICCYHIQVSHWL
jgi:hypothetical protein